jgi:hypothetical protein
MDVPHFTDPELFRWLLDPDVLDLVESVIGPDIALFSSHFICKPAGDGKSVPWHQDAHFWRDRIDPAEHANTVWLAAVASSSLVSRRPRTRSRLGQLTADAVAEAGR